MAHRLFTPKSFESLISYYEEFSHTQWIAPFLRWIVNHSEILLPIYIFYEITIGILLSLLIFRGPALLANTLLCSILAFAEFGVSATWPPNPNILTWEWELLFVSWVSLWLGVRECLIALQQPKPLRYLILGKSVFRYLPIFKVALYALLAALFLYAVGIWTKIFGESYRLTSILSAMTFFTCLIFNAIIDRSYRWKP